MSFEDDYVKNLGFYHKTLTRTTKGTRLTLDLQKLMDLAWFLLVGRELGEEKGEKSKLYDSWK